MVNYTAGEELPTSPQDDRPKHSSLWLGKLKRKLLSHVFLARAIFLLFGVVFLFAAGLLLNNLFGETFSRVTFLPRQALIFLLGKPTSLESKEGRTNILLLGAGGAGHEAPELTDTMIFVSLDHKGKNPVFVSLPRDTWVPSLRAKLNTTYYYGNQKKENGGLILSGSSVSEVLGQPVHYALAVDFGVFVKLIDLLGGVEVNVERAFDDFKYPIPGRENDGCSGDKEFKCRYEHVHFPSGRQTMDGEKALKFVRSRNAEGEEGTDFARSSRQQKVIEAIKKRVLSPRTIFNPGKLGSLWQIATESFKTDIPQDKIPILARMYLRIPKNKVKNLVLDGGGNGDAQTGFLVNPPISARYDYQWVLVPRDSTWEEVRKWLAGILYLQK